MARESTAEDTHHSSRAALPFAGASVSAHARAVEPGRSEQPCPPHNGAPVSLSPSCGDTMRSREREQVCHRLFFKVFDINKPQ